MLNLKGFGGQAAKTPGLGQQRVRVAHSCNFFKSSEESNHPKEWANEKAAKMGHPTEGVCVYSLKFFFGLRGNRSLQWFS